MTLTIVFGCTTLISGWILWACRSIILELFGRIRHWFLRNRGYGFALFYEPNKRLITHYTKLNETHIKFNGRTYANVPERQFDYKGIRSILFNLNDANPVNIYEQDKSNELKNNSKFWDNFASLLKLYYQTNTNETLIMTLIIVIFIASIITACMTGYLLYVLSESGALVVPI